MLHFWKIFINKNKADAVDMNQRAPASLISTLYSFNFLFFHELPCDNLTADEADHIDTWRKVFDVNCRLAFKHEVADFLTLHVQDVAADTTFIVIRWKS